MTPYWFFSAKYDVEYPNAPTERQQALYDALTLHLTHVASIMGCEVRSVPPSQ